MYLFFILRVPRRFLFLREALPLVLERLDLPPPFAPKKLPILFPILPSILLGPLELFIPRPGGIGGIPGGIGGIEGIEGIPGGIGGIIPGAGGILGAEALDILFYRKKGKFYRRIPYLNRKREEWHRCLRLLCCITSQIHLESPEM
jgi:hypothetical protein